jgi:hypothetical protein
MDNIQDKSCETGCPKDNSFTVEINNFFFRADIFDLYCSFEDTSDRYIALTNISSIDILLY